MPLVHRFLLRSLLLALIVVAGVRLTAVAGDAKTPKDYLSNLPFTMPELTEPVFPDRVVSIVEHGAVADGKTLNTKAFTDAITACASAGGGTVLVPAGTWLTGPFKLRSNINLHLERGALIQFSSRFEDFPLINGVDGKSTRFMVSPPISGFQLKNIAITGPGMIDGAGEAWRPVKKIKMTAGQWKKLTATGALTEDGKIWWPSKEAAEGEAYLKTLEAEKKNRTPEEYAKAREFLRPNMVQLVQCTGILIDGPTFRNSPRFHVYPIQSENIIVRNAYIVTDWHAQNGDGLDFNACRNVLAYNVTVDVGDDAICIKPGRLAEYQSPGPACENIVIADCVVLHGHGGFVIGSESKGGARNIFVKNCIFNGTDVGLRFKSGRGRGGPIEKIYIEDIQMRAIANEAILFDMYYEEGTPEELATAGAAAKKTEPVNDLTPRFSDFHIKDVVCTSAGRAVLINGLPEMPVKNIVMENVSLAAEKGVLCVDAEGITLKSADIRPARGPVLNIDQSKNFTVDVLTYPQDAELVLAVDGDKTEGIVLRGVDMSRAKKGIELAKVVKPDVVKQ